MSNLTNEETLVLRTLLEQAVQLGIVTAYDEEGYDLIVDSKDVEAILESLGDTELEIIYIQELKDPSSPAIEDNRKHVGWVELMFGGDAASDLIVDHTDNYILDEMVSNAMLALENSRVFSMP